MVIVDCAKVPGIENRPASSVIVVVPARGPSTTVTLAPFRGLLAVSLTSPASENVGGSVTGGNDVGSDGDLPSAHPTENSNIAAAT
jgi:hypothetical protein